tara:strand:- start:389 stop:2134 length:1746 start_codon:yes stop_codon:yes gene_type:complete
MLDVTPQNLYLEIEAAETLRDSYLESFDDIVDKFTGEAYQEGHGISVPENHVYEYLSLTVPKLIYDNPRVHVSTRRPVTQRGVAEALEHGINRWIRDTRVRDVLERVAYDMLMAYGVIMTSEAPQPGYSPGDANAPHWPMCYRIPPQRFFMDPVAGDITEARFVGHKWVRDKNDLLEEADDDGSWNKEVIENLTENTGLDELGRNTEDLPDRHEIVGYEVWVPEIGMPNFVGEDSDFNGTIYTIGVSAPDENGKKKSDFIREPRNFYGPKYGPYSLFGVYSVPERPYPLSPIIATLGQMDDLNAHVQSATTSAAMYKRLVFVDARNKKLIQDIKSQPDNYVVPVEGLSGDSVVPAEFGGITRQQIDYISMARDRLDRNSGMHDAQRGVVTGDATATEVQVAESSGSLRFAYIRRQFQESVRRTIENAAWYMYHDDRVVFPLGAAAAEALGIGEPYFVGGIPEQITGAKYSDVELEIDTYSMERANEALLQRRAMEAYNIVMQSAQLMVNTPYIDWSGMMSKLGDAMNIPELGELINKEQLQQMVMAAQQQQEQQQAAQSIQAQAAANQSNAQAQQALMGGR